MRRVGERRNAYYGRQISLLMRTQFSVAASSSAIVSPPDAVILQVSLGGISLSMLTNQRNFQAKYSVLLDVFLTQIEISIVIVMSDKVTSIWM